MWNQSKRAKQKLGWLALSLALGASAKAGVVRAQSAGVLPPGFSESIVTGDMTAPTAMEFAPDGRLFVALQNGRVRIVKNGVRLDADFLNIPVDYQGERGLLGLSFDPNFSTNRFLYFYYTVPASASRRAFNRVSRFRTWAANPDVAEAGSEQVIFEGDELNDSAAHNGGALHFGPDGKLYIATGDNGYAPNAQQRYNLLGKMLRINADGTMPTDNPFNRTGNRYDALWAMGLRNPFTFGFDPANGRMFIDDVGAATWEEINDGVAGSNYGWPNSEGATTNAGERGPLYTYRHGTYDAGGQGFAITGGVFYRGSQFPASYAGKYFYQDYVRGWIRVLDPATAQSEPFAVPRDNISGVDLDVGPDGALYYLSFAQGSVFRIAYSAAPAIASQPQDQAVSAGADVTFSVAASGGAPLAYQWQRNGINIAGATSPTYSFTAALADNSAQFRVIVSNSLGSVTSRSAVLSVRNSQAPLPVISAPLVGAEYRAGQVLAFAGSATDPEDGALAPSALTWEITFHHDTHSHPFYPPTAGIAGGSVSIPNVGETSDNVWYRVRLSARDSSGLSTTVTRDVLPHKAQMTINTRPPGLEITLDGAPQDAPLVVTGVTGLKREIGASSPQTVGNVTYTFKSWSDGGARVHPITTPEIDTVYTALFADNRPPAISFDGRFGDNYSYKTLPAFFGTASDEGVGLDRVAATLQRTSDGAYWNGSAWTAAASTYAATLAADGSWQANLPALGDGRYLFSATTFDLGGASTSTAAIRVIIDNAAPIIAFSSPVNGASFKSLSAASGTATDAGGGVASVSARLQRLSDNAFYNPATGTWQFAEVSLSVTGMESWSAALPTLGDGNYRLSTTAADYIGNSSTSSASFAIDNSGPIITINSPAAGLVSSLAGASGTALDAAGISGVRVQLQRLSDNAFYNPATSTWQATAADLSVTGAQSWAARLPALADGSYRLSVVATDVLGNSSTSVRVFRVDRTPPRVAQTSPRANDILRSQPVVRGTASDANGVQALLNLYRLVYLNNRPQWQVWSRSGGWVLRYDARIHDLNVARTSAQSLSWNALLPSLSSGRYATRAIAVDDAGNRTFAPFVQWTFDRNAPFTAITAPPANASLSVAPLVRGTASDVGTGVRTTTLLLFRQGVGYWTGSGWSRTYSAQNERPVTVVKRVLNNTSEGTRTDIEWTMRLPSLPPGHYSLRASVSDGAGFVSRSAGQLFTIPSAPSS